MDFDGNSSLTDIDGSVTRSCREIDKEGMQLIIQPDREKWNANDICYKNEARRIAVLNEIFGDVELSTEEMRTMVWLAGWEDSTVENVVSAIRKGYGIGRKAAGTAAPSVGRKKLPAGRKDTFDGRNRLSKVLLRYFRESNKAYAPYPALITLKQGERTAY